MEEITSQECEREFRDEERMEARSERKFDEAVRYAPRGEDASTGEFFAAALELSNALGLLDAGDLKAANQKDRLGVHALFGKAENALAQAKRRFYQTCVEARLVEDE